MNVTIHCLHLNLWLCRTKIYVIESKTHLSFPKCILSEWSVFALHYGDKSIAQKGGVFINSFWLLDIKMFLNLGCFVPLTQIRWSNVINSLIWKCFCMHRSTALRSLLLIHHRSYTHYMIIDGSCLGRVHLFFSFVTGGRTLDGGLFCRPANSIKRSFLWFEYWSSFLPITWPLTHFTTLCGTGQRTL